MKINGETWYNGHGACLNLRTARSAVRVCVDISLPWSWTTGLPTAKLLPLRAWIAEGAWNAKSGFAIMDFKIVRHQNVKHGENNAD